MISQDTLTAAFRLAVVAAADNFSDLRADTATAKGGFTNRLAEGFIARLLADDAETVAGASRWVGDVLKDHPAQSTANAYRSALKWYLTSDRVTALRAMVTPEAANDPEAFRTVALAAAGSVGDYWAAYKADKKAAKEAKPKAPAQGTIGKTVPDAEPAPEPAPEPDAEMEALTRALSAIAELRAMGAEDALAMIAEALAAEAEVEIAA